MSKKKKLVNTETNQSVDAFLENIGHKKRKADSYQVLQIMKAITGKDPKIWGRSIVAFGKYSYKRKNGETYEWFNVGFSPAKAHLSIYLMFDLTQEEKLLSQLGPHRIGKGCLYIKDLTKIDMGILKELISKSDRWER